ncbi:MAG: 4-hydroxythreonine-4-phosphate dehydrogenase PdxA [Ruminiclostridium sp.]
MKPILGILLCEAAGIGPELVAKMCAQNKFEAYCRPLLIGDVRVLKLGMKIAGVEFPINIIEDISRIEWSGSVPIVDLKNLDAQTVSLATVDAKSGRATGETMLAALDLCKSGIINGFVYAPLNKAALKCGGFNFESEMNMMANYLGWQGVFGEMNVVNGLWTSRATSHIPFKEISSHLTIEVLLDAIRLAHSTLKRNGYDNPRIAVAALNPHAGEAGSCGKEEIEVIIPAIDIAKTEGINVIGPYPADTIFINAFKGLYDAVTTLYHDQGQIALKLMKFHEGVTVSTGLPYPITTPAHGTAFDIAGKGIADIGPMEQAVMIASKMAEW